MEYTILFWIIIAILLLDFAIENTLSYLNGKNAGVELPDEVKDIYDSEKYNKQQAYFQVNQKFSRITSVFGTLVTLAMFFLFGFNFVDEIARGFTDSTILVALIFFGIIFFANELISIPFGIYKTFVIEEKFGFNKMSPAIFATDLLKEWVMTAVLGGGLFALLMVIYEQVGDWFWLLGWGLMSAISIFLMMFYSNLIVPLFNKQTPLEAGELRDAIETFCNKAGFKLDNLYVIDGSKRTTKANAYFSGLGAKKRIVLYDTLINTLTTEEIVAVLAHEIGHYKKKHTMKTLILSLINNGVMFFLLSLALGKADSGNPEIALALGSDIPSFHFSMIVFGILFSPISTFIGLGLNTFSRKNEYEADAFAKSFGLAAPLGSALKKLSESTLSNLTPHPYYVFFHYSHPTLLQRLRALNK